MLKQIHVIRTDNCVHLYMTVSLKDHFTEIEKYVSRIGDYPTDKDTASLRLRISLLYKQMREYLRDVAKILDKYQNVGLLTDTPRIKAFMEIMRRGGKRITITAKSPTNVKIPAYIPGPGCTVLPKYVSYNFNINPENTILETQSSRGSSSTLLFKLCFEMCVLTAQSIIEFGVILDQYSPQPHIMRKYSDTARQLVFRTDDASTRLTAEVIADTIQSLIEQVQPFKTIPNRKHYKARLEYIDKMYELIIHYTQSQQQRQQPQE